MNSVQQFDRKKIKNQFERLFKDLISDKVKPKDWKQADIVFRNGKHSESFTDVEFLMASHQNGSSLLYSSAMSGSSVYSVIEQDKRISFSVRQ